MFLPINKIARYAERRLCSIYPELSKCYAGNVVVKMHQMTEVAALARPRCWTESYANGLLREYGGDPKMMEPLGVTAPLTTCGTVFSGTVINKTAATPFLYEPKMTGVGVPIFVGTGVIRNSGAKTSPVGLRTTAASTGPISIRIQYVSLKWQGFPYRFLTGMHYYVCKTSAGGSNFGAMAGAPFPVLLKKCIFTSIAILPLAHYVPKQRV